MQMQRMNRFLLPPLLIACALLGLGCGAPKPSFDRTMEEGVAEFDAGRYMEAMGVFKQAAEQDRERPEPTYYIGRCQLRMAEQRFREDNLPAAMRCCDAAIGAFDAAIGAFPGYSLAVQGKTEALKLKGKHDAALQIATWAATQSGPQSKMLILKGREYARAGDMDRAQLSFKQATTVEPDNAAAYAELGLFYMRMGNDAEAVQNLRLAYELNPGVPGVVAALARLGAMTETPRPR